MKMAQKLTYIYKMKSKLLVLSLLISPLLVSCSNEIKKTSFYFDTYTETRLFEGNEEDINNINKIFKKIDKLTDNYRLRDVNNVYYINKTNEKVKIDSDLYRILDKSFDTKLNALNCFNPLVGSLSKKWKESLSKKEVLNNEVISSEIAKMNSTNLEFLGKNEIQRVGEAEIDLGAVAKGYALDKVKEYLETKKYTKYLVDAGSSSILLGEKNGGENFRIKINNLDNAYLNLKNCVISTSSNKEQRVEIDGKIYSHIINPNDGSAINKHDAVIVVSDSGYLGDILSTDFVNESLDSIKTLETIFDVKTIVIKNNKITYQSKGLEVEK